MSKAKKHLPLKRKEKKKTINVYEEEKQLNYMAFGRKELYTKGDNLGNGIIGEI